MKPITTLAAALTLAAMPVAAEESAESRLANYSKDELIATVKQLRRATDELERKNAKLKDSLTEAQKKARAASEEAKNANRQLARMRRQVASLRSRLGRKNGEAKSQDGSLNPFHLKVGQAGHIDYESSASIVENGRSKRVAVRRWFEVVQVIDRSNLLARPIEDHRTRSEGDKRGNIVWLRGYSTDQIVDGSRIKPKGRVKVVGTKQYDTPVGTTNTVFVIEALESEQPAE